MPLHTKIQAKRGISIWARGIGKRTMVEHPTVAFIASLFFGQSKTHDHAGCPWGRDMSSFMERMRINN